MYNATERMCSEFHMHFWQFWETNAVSCRSRRNMLMISTQSWILEVTSAHNCKLQKPSLIGGYGGTLGANFVLGLGSCAFKFGLKS